MRPEEAAYVGDVLNAQPTDQLSPVLELGATSGEFRTVAKPHIDRHIHGPLNERGVKIVTTDIRDEPGVDIAGDLYDTAVQQRLRDVGAGCVLCCNTLEHLEDRERFAAACANLVPPGGLLIVTVPHSYPYHLDPIDTGFRPTPQQIADLFPGFRLEDSAIVSSVTYMDDLRARGPVGLELAKSLARLVKVWQGGRWRERASRMTWLFRPYKVSIAVLRKPA